MKKRFCIVAPMLALGLMTAGCGIAAEVGEDHAGISSGGQERDDDDVDASDVTEEDSDAGQGGEGCGEPEISCHQVSGNPTCSSQGLGEQLVRIDPVETGTFGFDGGTVTLETSDGIYFDFEATTAMHTVIVKGGPMALICTFGPGALSFDDLHAPINESNDTPYGLSHVDFCEGN